MRDTPTECVAQIRARLKRHRVRADRFHILREPPFVVVGDESADVVRRRGTETVRWAVERLRSDYSAHDPPRTVALWLFRDAHSYEDHARLLFGDKPETPFGYYAACHHAVLMNMATGTGTLVHEIVHPFMRANFLGCPPWFDEGLASLYEHCMDRACHIVGLHNWRLPALQTSVRSGRCPTVPSLMAMDNAHFFGADSGLHYAAARYLCFYLQEKSLLVRFYREFLCRRMEDTTGWKTFKAVAEIDSMSAFQQQWEQYVLDADDGYAPASESYATGTL